ncbi:tyrosine-type recombinase/integrase [Microbispora catharanthi]|uniref:tyrosine-type recombinase/integrase n=1 Tax=Microbispora catharanthi TaxID=1712871 RepID=UPI00197C59D4|nr:tyrosine-type recombinase/integrase [Microbispora catharanthi]
MVAAKNPDLADATGTRPEIDPDRAGFTIALDTARDLVIQATGLPRPAAAADVAKVLAAICTRRPCKDLPLDRLRDRVLFETAYVCGARASEVCGLYVEDLDLRLDDAHVRICGKGGSVRTVLLDDRGYVTLLKLYLARSGYTAGPLFRASLNGAGGPLSYDAAQPPLADLLRSGSCRDRHPPAASRPRRPSSSTPVCPSRPCAAASATPPPRSPSCTRCWTTRSPTPRSAPPADAEISAARRRRDQAIR